MVGAPGADLVPGDAGRLGVGVFVLTGTLADASVVREGIAGAESLTGAPRILPTVTPDVFPAAAPDRTWSGRPVDVWPELRPVDATPELTPRIGA